MIKRTLMWYRLAKLYRDAVTVEECEGIFMVMKNLSDVFGVRND
jgi:hypothetical protein